VFPVRYGKTYTVEKCFKYKAGLWIMSRNVIVTLIYHYHKPIDLISNNFDITMEKEIMIFSK
jgi:hypothetical protein